MLTMGSKRSTTNDCPLPAGSRVAGYFRDSGGDEQERSVNQQRRVAEEYCQRHHPMPQTASCSGTSNASPGTGWTTPSSGPTLDGGATPSSSSPTISPRAASVTSTKPCSNGRPNRIYRTSPRTSNAVWLTWSALGGRTASTWASALASRLPSHLTNESSPKLVGL